MAEQIEFELVSPERLLLARPVEMVVVPGAEGDFGALPGHAPFVSVLRPGVIAVFDAGRVTERIFTTIHLAHAAVHGITLSAGAATLREDMTGRDLVAEADRAMYLQRAELRSSAVTHPVER